MMPVFFKAIRPAGAVKKPDAEPSEDLDSDIIPNADDAENGPADAEKPPADAESGKKPADSGKSDADPAGDDTTGGAPADDALPQGEPADGDPADDAPAGDADAKAAPGGDKPDMENFTELLAIIAERVENSGDFGPHNVKPGHHVAFSAGDFAGSGKVAAAGRDGARVHDSSGREHSVHWREVTGHFAGDDEDAAPAKGKAKGDDK